MKNLFNHIGAKEKSSAVETLIEDSTPSKGFYIMVVLAVAMAAIGLLLNNAAIVIGSMLISPLLLSLLGVAMGLSMSNWNLIWRSLYTFLWSIFLGVVIALLMTWLFSSVDSAMNQEILSRSASNLLFFVVAFIAGFAGAFSLVNPKLSQSLSGIAISVALIPPIATIGIGVGLLRFDIMFGAITLLLTNAVGILTASLIVFSAMDFHSKKKLADETIKEEEKELEKEVEMV